MHILSHHPHKTSNYPRNSKRIHLLSRRASQCPQPLCTPQIGPIDLGQVKELLLVTAVRGDNRTGDASLYPTEALHTVGILQLTDAESAGCLGVREARLILFLHLCFLSVLSPVTKCPSRLRCLANCPSRAASNNSASGKPFWTVLYHKTTALSLSIVH